MAERAQIEQVFEKLKQVRPVECFKSMDETQAGIGAVLLLLFESGTVTAGKISDVLNVSTARVAALLKKMSAKGLVTKERGILDARMTLVHLTPLGEETIKKMQDKMYCQIGIALDTVGQERLLEFIATAKELQSAMKPPDFF